MDGNRRGMRRRECLDYEYNRQACNSLSDSIGFNSIDESGRSRDSFATHVINDCANKKSHEDFCVDCINMMKLFSFFFSFTCIQNPDNEGLF